MSFATYIRDKNIRDLYRRLNEFQREYEPRSNLANDENDDLFVDSHNILYWLKNRLFHLSYFPALEALGR
jgi:hypothetical protein